MISDSEVSIAREMAYGSPRFFAQVLPLHSFANGAIVVVAALLTESTEFSATFSRRGALFLAPFARLLEPRAGLDLHPSGGRLARSNSCVRTSWAKGAHWKVKHRTSESLHKSSLSQIE